METGSAVGYIRVSTDEQAGSGAGLAAQRKAIRQECERREWKLVRVFEDAGVSGKSLAGRPGLRAALELVESGGAQALVVSKLDRLSRSLLDFAGLMVRAQQKKWNLVALDLGIDMSTPAGEFMANVMASAAQWERRIIGQRTRDALAVKRAQGVRLGRPATIDEEVRASILGWRADGLTFRGIAEQLNAAGVPTAHGGKRWYASTVRDVLAQRPQQESV